MSVDPDDTTPTAIKNAGQELLPTVHRCCPGQCFCWHTISEDIPILGLLDVMYAKRTIFDLVLPRVMADERLTASDLHALGIGVVPKLRNLCIS